MTPLSARSSSPREGAGSPRIKVAAARLISERGGDPGGLPVVSTLPAAESTVHTAAGTVAPFTVPAGVSWLPGAACSTTTPGRTLRWIALRRQFCSAQDAAAIAADGGLWPGPEERRKEGDAPCLPYAMRGAVAA